MKNGGQSIMLWFSKNYKKYDCITFFIYLWEKGFRHFFCHYKKGQMNDKKMPKNAEEFICEYCDFQCYKKSNYAIHLTTRKHKMNDERMTNDDNFTQENADNFICDCGKKYKYRQGLWSHKKKCSQKPEINVNNREPPTNILTNDIVLALINENKEIQKIFMEERKILMEKITELSKPQNNTVTNTNSHNNNSNNNFNLNFFLNEQCKDAVNLVDFIDNLKVTVKDLERTGQLGFVEGISKIFIEGLKELDIYKRPIHCTDLKRETVYVRDQDKWEKENEEKPRLKTAVKKIAVKNIKQLRNWEVENPEFSNVESKKNDEYMVISQNSLGGFNDKEESKYQNTIIKNVLKTAKLPTDESIVPVAH